MGAGLVAIDCHAAIDGGFVYGRASRLDLLDIVATNCSAATGKGGAVYVESMYHVTLRNPTLRANTAFEGGALYARSCGVAASRQRYMSTDWRFRGVRVFDGLLADNGAHVGVSMAGGRMRKCNAKSVYSIIIIIGEYGLFAIQGAVAGSDQSLLFAVKTEFRDNYNFGGGGRRGSLSAFLPDAIFVQCDLSTSVEDSPDGSMIVAQRLVVDDTIVGPVNQGAAVALLNATDAMRGGGFPGDSYRILVRNSDLSGLEVFRRDDPSASSTWDFAQCHPLNQTPRKPSIATSNYHLATEEGLPSLASASPIPLAYSPVCPADAECSDSLSTFSITCICSSASSAFPSVYNELASCQTYVSSGATLRGVSIVLLVCSLGRLRN